MLLFFLAAGVGAACSGASLAECQVRALNALPSDPELVDAREVRQLVGALEACRAAPDGGL
jgi:hypothetical protein